MPTNKRPKRLSFGDAIARPIRGPKKDQPRSFYWQVQRERGGERVTLFSCWGTREEIKTRTIDFLANEPSPEEAARLRMSSIETVRDVLETFVGSQRSRYEAGDLTQHGYRASRNDGRHLARLLGRLALSGLRRAELENYRNTRLIEGAASSTVKREIKTMRSAWRWALDSELIPDRELPRVKVKVEPARTKYNPTPEECWRVIEQLNGWPRFVASILAVTGTRIGAVAHLQYGGIQSGSVLLFTKGKPIRFPLTDQLRAALELANYETEYLHGTTPTMVTGHFSSRELPRACEKAGVQRFSSHGFRRAAVDALQRAGVDIKTAADLLGHSPEVMLRYYREASPDDLRGAAERLGELMTPGGSMKESPPRVPRPTPDSGSQSPRAKGAVQRAGAPRRAQSDTDSATTTDPGFRKEEGPQGLTSAAGLRNGTPKGN